MSKLTIPQIQNAITKNDPDNLLEISRELNNYTLIKKMQPPSSPYFNPNDIPTASGIQDQHDQYIHDELSRMHQLLDRFSIDDHALNNKTFQEFLRQASIFVWESLVELNHITSPVEEE